MKLKTKIEFFQDSNHLIKIDSIEHYEDGSGYSSLLTVQSEPFGCVNHQFYFENLKPFLKDILKLHKRLKGSAGIGPTRDIEHIKFEAKSRGNITVSGELQVYSDHPQKLKFSFETDQSYLGSLVASAESALNEIKKR